MNTVTLNAFEQYAHKIKDQYQIPGITIGLSQDGQKIYERGFGYRNVDQQLEVNSDTVFGVASVTKSFTCVAIMQLQEQGKLSVHDPVRKYLPEFQTPDRDKTEQMTIHHFMTHTAGLPPFDSLFYANKRTMDQDPSVDDYPGLNIDKKEQEPIDTYEQLMAYIARLDFELLGAPGAAFSYSNDAYALLGAIIERVSGMTYEAYVHEYILQPCGMTNSTFDLTELDTKNITALYARKADEEDEVYEAPVWWDAPAMRAAGYLKSTVNDMLRYTEIFRNNGAVGQEQILTRDSVAQMVQPYIEIEPGRYYGYGLVITPDYYGTKLVEHGGSLKAIASLVAVLPEKGLAGMILTNLAGVPAGKLLHAAFNDIQGRSVEETHIHFETLSTTPDQIKPYEGTYQSNEGMVVSFVVEDGELVLYAEEKAYPARCIGQDLFAVHMGEQESIIRFVQDERGQVDQIFYHLRLLPKVK